MGGELYGDVRPNDWLGALGSRPVMIRSELPNVEARSGILCQCADCDGESFAVWQIDGHEAPHLQCVACGRVYCWGHNCAAEAAEEESLQQGGG